MKHSDRNQKHARSFSARIGGAIGLLLTLGLLLALLAAPAFATYEQVASFGASGEAARLGEHLGGFAVNTTGAGGVPTGTVYAATRSSVSSYTAKGEFREAWGWNVSVGGENEFERCGPDGEPAHPNCKPKSESLGRDGEGVGQMSFLSGVAVDQATGDVYVLNDPIGHEHDVVQVFNADGSQLIAGFGDRGDLEETFDEGPEKIHRVEMSAIAVDSSGLVYISDYVRTQNRTMVFEPQSPGDYEHYVYAGRGDDIATEIATEIGPVNLYSNHPVVDSAGNLYLVLEDNAIDEFAAGEPTIPVCKFKLPVGGIEGMTVNPASGEVFFFSIKNKKIHQLSPCNPQGKFVETTAFTLTPVPLSNPAVLAFNPGLSYEASRPAGALYAALQHNEPPSEDTVTNGFIFVPPKLQESPPVVEAESVAHVTQSSAELRSQINPKGFETRYAFQYLTEAAYEENEPADRFAGATEAPVGGAVLGTGQAGLPAAAGLSELSPDTEYRYRVIAKSECAQAEPGKVCVVPGAAQSFRTFPVQAPGLPDDRAYELVSPAQKHGGEVFPANGGRASCVQCKPRNTGGLGFPMQSAPDGEAVVYEGFPFSFTEGSLIFNEYLSRRTEAGWQTTALSPALQEGGGYMAFDAGLTRGLLAQNGATLSPEAPSGYANLYAQPTATPSTLTPLLKSEPLNRNPNLTYAGASADFSRTFFEANDALLTAETPFAPEAEDGGASKNNLYESAGGQLRLVNVLPGNAATTPGAAFGSGRALSTENLDFSHAISDDGSRVFWSDEAGQVYVRENGESTREISDHTGGFLTASADGSKLLLSNGHLYDLETEETTDLTQGEGGFEGILGQSEDLSHVYFVDTATLSGEEENDQGAKAQAGKDNLYAWNEGDLAFLATLDPSDGHGGSPGGNLIGDWESSPAHRTAEASPDGRWVAFISEAPLSGYDNTDASSPALCGAVKGICDAEVFLYDSATGTLSCPSCNPSGERPLGPSALGLIESARGSLPQPRYLTDQGRLYFDSQDSLTPFDTNDGVEDVYQYEPEGVGNPPCKREAGCVSLISAGHEPVDSNFLAADPSGKNVFFTSRDQLVLKDRDELIDLYDAREGGGIPSETETARGECQGEACQPAISPPNDPTPGSSSFEGAGNVVEEKPSSRCPKGKARRKGRCVATKHHKRAKRAHHRTANHSRGGAK